MPAVTRKGEMATMNVKQIQREIDLKNRADGLERLAELEGGGGKGRSPTRIENRPGEKMLDDSGRMTQKIKPPKKKKSRRPAQKREGLLCSEKAGPTRAGRNTDLSEKGGRANAYKKRRNGRSSPLGARDL